jgi:hypothetical protein
LLFSFILSAAFSGGIAAAGTTVSELLRPAYMLGLPRPSSEFGLLIFADNAA